MAPSKRTQQRIFRRRVVGCVLCCLVFIRLFATWSASYVDASENTPEGDTGFERQFDAIIFDCDGTLVDTETPYMVSFNQAISDLYIGQGDAPAVSKQEFGAGCSGRGLERCAEYALSHFDIEGNVTSFVGIWKAHMADLIQKPGSIQLMDGFDELYTYAKSRNMKVGVASSSDAAGLRMKLINGVVANSDVVDSLDAFDAIVSNDEVTRHKPDPEIYLLAAKMMDVSPASCWVVEDSETGILAARRAGMSVAAVPNEYTQGNSDFSEANLSMSTMAELVNLI